MKTRSTAQSALSAAKWMTGSSAVVFITSFVGNVFATRALGPADYGVYAYLVWLVTLIAASSTGFLNITAIRFLAEGEGAGKHEFVQAATAWLKRLMRISLGVACLIFLATAAMPSLYPPAIAEHMTLYACFVLACVFGRATFSFLMSVAKGHSIYYPEAVSSSITGMLAMVAAAVLLWLGQGLSAYMALFLIASLGILMLGAAMMRKHGIQGGHGVMDEATRARMANVLKWNAIFSAMTMLTSKSVDTYLLGLYAPTAYVGFYSIASTMNKSGLELLSAGYSSMLLPLISRAGGEGDHSKVQRIYTISIKFYQTVGIVAACGAWLVAEPVVRLIYGQAYLEVVPALKLLTLASGLGMPYGAFSAVFIATDSKGVRIGVIVFSTIVALGTSLFFIPKFGYQGALYSVMTGTAITYTVTGIIIQRVLGFKFPVRSCVVQGISGLIPMLLIHAVMPAPSPLWAAMAFGVLWLLSFGFLALNLGAWNQEEVDMLKRTNAKVGRLIDLMVLRKL